MLLEPTAHSLGPAHGGTPATSTLPLFWQPAALVLQELTTLRLVFAHHLTLIHYSSPSLSFFFPPSFPSSRYANHSELFLSPQLFINPTY